MNRLRMVVGALGICACVGACSSGGTESAVGDLPEGDGVLATLDVISAEVTARIGEGGTFASVAASTDLGQGDQVRTDASGFAEVVFFDGSWQRVENDTTLTLTELVDIEDGRVVRTGIDRGRAWQRVETLTNEEDAFEVDTPVAVASVRGTAFSIDCSGEPIACTFAVTDGVVDLALSDGSDVALGVGQLLTVHQDQPVGTPQDVGLEQLQQDQWIARNLVRDATDPPVAPGGDGGTGDGSSEGATGAFADEANAMCASAGEQSAVAGASDDADAVAEQQASVLDGALDRLEGLEPPQEISSEVDEMIDSYRQRTALVRRALAAPAVERQALVVELLSATATGAARARDLGLVSCIVRSG